MDYDKYNALLIKTVDNDKLYQELVSKSDFYERKADQRLRLLKSRVLKEMGFERDSYGILRE